MKIIIPLIGYAVAAYFLIAAFHPPLRIRWGVKRVIGWSPKGTVRARYRLPKMGAVNCLGMASFVGALITIITFGDTPGVARIATPLCIGGMVVAAIGRMLAGNPERY